VRLHGASSHRCLGDYRLIALFTAAGVCLLGLTSCVKSGSDHGGTGIPAYAFPGDANSVAPDGQGPTLLLSYSKETFKPNPIGSFMYFVPLIAPTLVDSISSADNSQQVGFTSYQRTVTSKSFDVVCEFEILGTGFHENTFDPAGMIAAHTDGLKKGKVATNLLDYIKFEGDCYGVIKVKGEVAESVMTVTEVEMQFNARGHQSPVTIGLYDVPARDGQYRYENRTNQAVARVNTLVFKKSEEDPRMEIKVASVGESPDVGGFWANLKGAIANLLIKPIKVEKIGNDTMLQFGYALAKQESTFTFPRARNIKESKIVPISPAKEGAAMEALESTGLSAPTSSERAGPGE
jgi:hypothetical protein